MPAAPRLLGRLMAPIVLFLVACASRPIETKFPPSSAASPEAVTATIPEVTTALEADPPLPGESTEGWPGLEPEPGRRPPGHDHHHGHGAHAPAEAPVGPAGASEGESEHPQGHDTAGGHPHAH